MGISSAWADFDGDGLLDVYAANYLCFECENDGRTDAEAAADTLWHNTGDAKLIAANDLLGDPQLRAGLGMQPTWFDFDEDGDLDLYVVNDKGLQGEPEPDGFLRRNVLFRNDGEGCDGHCFTEVAREVGLDQRIDGMCAAIGDYDNDSDLDVFMTDTDRGYLMRNDSGTFVDVSFAAGVGREMTGWGCAWMDYDNDGWLDLYAGGGDDSPDMLWANRGDGTFEERPDELATDALWSTAGLAAADYDGDGTVDLVLAELGVGYRLHRNRRPSDQGWLGLRLIGAGPGGRDAVGARAYVTTDDGLVQLRDVRIGSSLGSTDDTGLHFGLGDRVVESVLIRWPDGAEEQVSVPVNAWSTVERSLP